MTASWAVEWLLCSRPLFSMPIKRDVVNRRLPIEVTGEALIGFRGGDGSVTQPGQR